MADKEADACNITLDAHNTTVNNFCQMPVTPNTQGDNENTILTSERLNNSDALAETFKRLTINNAGYYYSDNNDAKGNPTIDSKVATHTCDRKKRKVTDTSNGILQQKLLINRNFLIITTSIDPQIPDRVATCGGTTHAFTRTTTKGVIQIQRAAARMFSGLLVM